MLPSTKSRRSRTFPEQSAEVTRETSSSLPIYTAEYKFSLSVSLCLSLCLDSEVTDVTGHLLDAAVRRAGDLVAAKGTVEVEEDAGLR